MIRPNSRAWLLVWLLWPLILIAARLSGCEVRPEVKAQASIDEPKRLVVSRDMETGCDYVSRAGYEGITPRMGADGKQICRPVKDAK